MLDVNALRGAIASKGYTQKRLASEMGISGQSLSKKIKSGVFKSTEIDTMIRLLEIENPMPIFFAQEVPCDATFSCLSPPTP